MINVPLWELKEIANLVIPLLQEYELHLSETAFENFIEYGVKRND